ncbi:MAG: OsmC family protein [Bacteroidia bacterium]
MKRSATAIWEGTGKEGSGHLASQSGVLNKARYSAKSRFEDENGTNPEELIAAAHAGCFAMKLGFILEKAGYTPDKLDVKCEITLEEGTITQSHLTLKAGIKNIDESKFKELAEEARKTCPVSKLLDTEIELNATLVN